jgi:hypothetical protein
MADMTAEVDGDKKFHVRLDARLPINREEVETRFAAELENDD